ncbi:GDP-mannose 4,6-dehydratase [Paenibacillus sp. 481]|uniref:GDP-mannose 4,6-dehydratase n=1 Tax=Paenibacillus sp. 481 TaxID=2835869 RepID=UPI001E29038E|nr:GDP-mannose 4,6-dehydratase [Paenibacillus sp. 481]UHA71652.1 GDP-mannose 4,6-dehydratase [Paenibacillus sp. 481]
MKKAIITGGTGFVAGHLANSLINKGYTVIGTTRNCCPELHFKETFEILKINYDDVDAWKRLLDNFRPDEIYHLAGQSSVSESWKAKVSTINANLVNTINILEAIRQSEVWESVKILTVGSSEEYGHINDLNAITERTPLQPISPYGISKASVSMLARQYSKVYKLNIIHARPFNHIGPGQSLGFITSDFAKQIISIEKGLQAPIINVGNLEAQRDFTDVRDIVEAYVRLMEGGIPGEVYNVCSGQPKSAQSILDSLIEVSCVSNGIEILRDETKLRPSDYPCYFGDYSKLKQETGWEPRITLTESLKDILDYWRTHIK